MTKRALTLGNRTINFATHRSLEVKVPNTYFGQEEDSADKTSKTKEASAWKISNIHGMPTTTSLIANCYNADKEYCFLVKPAPGSRKINIMSFKFSHSIEKMMFVSNNHILCKFHGGQSVTMLSNGSVIH